MHYRRMYLQVNQAAKRLGVSRQWIHELIKRGAIGTADIAGRRFVLDDLRLEVARRTCIENKRKP